MVRRSVSLAKTSESGNSIGQNANQRVFATLLCEAAAPFVERSTAFPGVPLEPKRRSATF
jgi:hypothetical protein